MRPINNMFQKWKSMQGMGRKHKTEQQSKRGRGKVKQNKKEKCKNQER